MKSQIILAAVAALWATGAVAQDFVQSGTVATLPGSDGKALYNSVCSGCHMPEGQGAVGAGMYPALAGSDFVESPDALIAWILNGHKAMPPLGDIMDDAQVAAIVNYVRHDLGNNYEGDTTAEDVAYAR